MKKLLVTIAIAGLLGVTSAHATVACKATIGKAVDLPLQVENHGMGDELVVRHDGEEISVSVDDTMLGTKALPRLDVIVRGPITFSTAAAPVPTGFDGTKGTGYVYAFSIFVKDQEIHLDCKP